MDNIKDHDFFGPGVNLNLDGAESIKTSCGGYCSLLQKLTVCSLLVLSARTIVQFDAYDVSKSLIFYDVTKETIDYSENIKDFTFGFKWEGEQVDMIDN